MSASRRTSNTARRLPVRVAAAVAFPVAAAYAAFQLFSIPPDKAGVGALTLSSLALVGVYARHRREREAEDEKVLAESKQKQLDQPATLHPVIDPDICIGSLSCLSVCPEGDILGVVDGKATLLNASACIGHGKCYIECPVGAIKLVFGTSRRGVDLPEVGEGFESARKGVHIIGELGGMGLIKNAMTQGLQLAEHLSAIMKPGGGDIADVAIVGAGPAGIAAALGLKAKGLSFRLLEQDTLGGTVYSYPRQKLVMTEPIQLPFFGKFGRKLISKEELLEQFTRAVKKADIRVEEKVKVTGIEGEDGNFTVQTTKGPVRARKVVLAIGRRGTPRKLGCKGEELEKVTYRLVDPEQYDGSRVLVVGGGDSAMEAAIQLAEQSDAAVSLSYRNPEFGKAREANKLKIRSLAEAGRVKLYLPSTVREIRPDEVELQHGQERIAVPNDFVIVCIGGELPTEFLNQVGVSMRRHYGTQPGEEVETARARPGSARANSIEERQRRLALALFSVGALIVAGLAVVGIDYYVLSGPERLKSPLHAMLKPSGPYGHGVGIVATLFMLSNFAYAVRKRWRRLKGTGHIRTWLTFHQFVGFMSPLAIAFHAAFQSKNHLATATAASLGVVVLTGLIGRYVFGLVSDSDGRVREHAEVLARWERYRHRLDELLEGIAEPAPVRRLVQRACAQPEGSSLLLALMRLPFEKLVSLRDLSRVRQLFPSADAFSQFGEAYRRVIELKVHVGFFRSLKRFLRVWRCWHVALALFLVVLIAAHIAFALYLGYRWVW